MNHIIYFKKSLFLVILTCFLSIFAFAQAVKPTTPKIDTLLNGLKVMIWSEPATEKVTVKIRIHSGAMFDPKDKMGVMALVADSLFPTDQAKAFFIEDLEGSIDVTTNYNYIQMTATGKSSEFLAMMETISSALVNPPLTPENFKLVSEARLKKVQELEKTPVYLADLTASKRLLGDFPYGRSIEGTSESLAKIDRVDLLFAKERFLTADNATIAISGNVKTDYAFRVTRQLFGGWLKADKKIPATFTMPNDPDITPQGIDGTKILPDYQGVELRFATRGIARKDKDYFALRFLTELLQTRLRAKVPKELQSSVAVTHDRNVLPGVVNFRVSFNPQTFSATNGINGLAISLSPNALLKESITQAEYEETRAKILAEIEQKPIVDKLLDIDTFKLVSAQDEMQKLNAVSLADMQRVADKLAKQLFATVILSNENTKP